MTRLSLPRADDLAGEPPMRVALVLGRSTGGIGTHVCDLAAGLRARGHVVRLVTDPLTARTFGIADALLAWPDPRRPDPDAWSLLRRTLSGADIVHAHGHQAGALVAAAFPRPGSGATRAALSLHNESPKPAGLAGRAALAIERAAVRRADLVTGASSDLVARADTLGARRVKLARVPSPRVPSLLAASDADRELARRAVRTAYGVGDDAALIVTISRIAPQKDLDTLVNAAARLQQPAAWLVAGGGIPALRADLERAAVATPVRFLGAVADPGSLLLAADVFALTSTWEARALVVQEALAAARPVVASHVGGIPDLLDGLGTMVTPGDPGAFADAVDGLLTDPEARLTAGRRGRERAATWPDSDAMVSEWVGDYRALIEAVG